MDSFHSAGPGRCRNGKLWVRWVLRPRIRRAKSMYLPEVWVPGNSSNKNSILCLFQPQTQLNKYILNPSYVSRFVLDTRDADKKTWPLLLRSSHSGWQDRIQMNNFSAKPSIFQEASNFLFSIQIPFLRACSICIIHLNSYPLVQPFIHSTDIY